MDDETQTGTLANSTVTTDRNGGLGRAIATRFVSGLAHVAVSDLARR